MKTNIRIARELVRLAKELIAVPTATFDEFDEFNKEYRNQTQGKSADSSIWDLFETQEEVENFLKAKSQAHPNLSEIIDNATLQKILKKGYFTICSAGISSSEYSALVKKYTDENGNFDENGFEDEKNRLVKSRLDEFCDFLDTFNVKYYEVLGQFYDDDSGKELPELAYVVDLTNIGENDDAEAKRILKRISAYCGNNMNQTSVIEGIRGVHAYVYNGDRSHVLSRGEEGIGGGRSTARHDKSNMKDQTSWSDDFGFKDKVEPTRKDWI